MRTTLWSSKSGDIAAQLAFTNNLGATADPGASDDSSKGYERGSVWINGTSKVAFTCVDASVGAAVWSAQAAEQAGSLSIFPQGAPAAKTVSGTLAAADVLAGIVTVNQGAGAASAQQLPLGSALDAALTAAIGEAMAVDTAFDLSVVNLSTVDAEDATVTTNTGMTLVGSMDFPAHSANTIPSAGILRFRKTAANTFTVYRVG